MTYFTILILIAILWGCVGFYWGVIYGKTKAPFIDIRRIIEREYPDQWSAYHHGINEGYEQGLRDGQDFDHEPPRP